MVKCNVLRCQCGCCTLPMRYIVAVLISLAIVVCYGHRMVLNVAITEMVVVNHSTSNHACPQNAHNSTLQKVKGGKKIWNEDVQSWLLAMFYPGYFISQLPLGYACDRFGPRWPLLLGIFVSTVGTFLTPSLVLSTNWQVVAGSRFVIGLGQGMLYPAAASFLQRWIPPSERSTIGGIVYATTSWGIICGNAVTGFVVAQYENWTLSFSIWGTIGVIWLVIAFFYLFSYPESHPFIPPKEEHFLRDEIDKLSTRPLPIFEVLRSCPVWALVAGLMSHAMVMFLMGTNFPKYMNNVLNYNIKENSALSLIPFVLMWVGSIPFGLLSDWLLRNNLKISLVRRTMAMSSSIFPFVFLMAATYSNCNRTHALIFFTLAMFMVSPAFSSLRVNFMDLTTSHAGFLMALANGIGAISGFFTPKVISWIADENLLGEWHSVFWGINAVQLAFMVTYCVFLSGERAKWDYTPEEYMALPRKPVTKWYLQLPPQKFEKKKKEQRNAAARRAFSSRVLEESPV